MDRQTLIITSMYYDFHKREYIYRDQLIVEEAPCQFTVFLFDDPDDDESCFTRVVNSMRDACALINKHLAKH
ncbi:MAG: hypothetical protein MJZ30_11540 [Paludibacteraceae bacterium]|nr:hypothetical protein [Paludibacteraceae bacterium]